MALTRNIFFLKINCHTTQSRRASHVYILLMDRNTIWWMLYSNILRPRNNRHVSLPTTHRNGDILLSRPRITPIFRTTYPTFHCTLFCLFDPTCDHPTTYITQLDNPPRQTHERTMTTRLLRPYNFIEATSSEIHSLIPAGDNTEVGQQNFSYSLDSSTFPRHTVALVFSSTISGLMHEPSSFPSNFRGRNFFILLSLTNSTCILGSPPLTVLNVLIGCASLERQTNSSCITCRVIRGLAHQRLR